MNLTLTDHTEKVASSSTSNIRGQIQEWRDELDGYYSEMREFCNIEPDDIFIKISGMTSRVSGIRSLVVRMNSRAAQTFRTQEIDPFLTEADRQFKLWSRVQSVRQMDADMMGKL